MSMTKQYMSDDEHNTQLLTEHLKLVRENERLKEALRSIARYAENASFGGWRHFVFGTAKAALGQGVSTRVSD